MREIKFRGQRVDNKKWVYGFVVKHSYLKKYFIYEMLDNIGALVSEVIPETVGQYTGLKDKNGVEIYEGDILQEGDKSIWSRYEVVWNQDFCSFGLDCKRVSPNIQYPSWNRAKNMVIIGNIHSNPELLK